MNTNSNQQATSLQMFYNEEMGVNVRSKVIDNEPWFVAKDICNALDIANPRDAIKKMLDEDEKGVANFYTPAGNYQGGGNQQLNIVNESGLYNLIFRSRKPEARAFRKWVTNVVLPSIRRTGSYSSNAVQSPIEDQPKKLPLPKFRSGFAGWKEKVKPYIGKEEIKRVAVVLEVSASHVRKVYAGTAVSERVARILTEAALFNRSHGVEYPEALPVYEQLSLEWEEQE